jgi:hypothetical protein
MPSPIVKQTLELNETEWTPVTPPYDVNSVAIRNLTDGVIELRVDKDDPRTGDVIGGNSQEGYTGPTPGGTLHQMRFNGGIPIVYLRSAKGAGPVLVRITMVI